MNSELVENGVDSLQLDQVCDWNDVKVLQAELQRLQKENSDLLRIYRDMPDTYYRANNEGMIIQVSPSAEALMGCTVETLVGQKLTDYYIYPEDRVLFLEKLTASGGVVRDHEHQVRRATGEVVWLSTNAQYVYEDGCVVGVEGIIRDITHRKGLEEKVMFKEKHQALQGLIAGIAHYFNNDLAAIAGFLYLLKGDMKNNVDACGYLEYAENKVFHIADIIKELLIFSEQSSSDRNIDTLNVAHLLEQAVARFEETLDKPLNIRLMISDYLVEIRCDAEEMTSALLHVLNNAKDAMADFPQASIDVTLHVLSLPNHKQHVEITVVDHGCGMSDEVLVRAKEPFFTTKEVGKGKGLSLAVTSGIIEQHQGDFHLKSMLGEGTVVHIFLPAMVVA